MSDGAWRSMKIQWLGKENCMDVLIQCYLVSKWFTTWFTFLIFVVFMNRNNMWHHVSSCSHIFVIHLIFVAFMNCVECVSSKIMPQKMIFHKIPIVIFWTFIFYEVNFLGYIFFCGYGFLATFFHQIKYSKSLIIGMTANYQ